MAHLPFLALVTLMSVLKMSLMHDKSFNWEIYKTTEHTPFHKKDKNNLLIDVRDNTVHFMDKSYSLSDPEVKVFADHSEINNGKEVKITWENPHPNEFDMIALYTPPSRDVQDYLDYRYVSDTIKRGGTSGYFKETLFNMRSDYELRYLAIDEQQRATVKSTFRITFPDNEPMHGHIAVTGVPGEMRVMWGSARADSPRVKFSRSADLSHAVIVQATTTTYSADDLCGARANVTSPVMYQDPGFFHTALLKGLKPGVRYYYSYGTDDQYSTTKSFIGAPWPESNVTETRLVGYGDMGVYYPPYNGDSVGAAPVTKGVETDFRDGNVDLVLHFGDLSYARGRGYIWDQFMTQMTWLSEQVPYMVGVGNHEYDHVSGGEKDPSGAEGQGFHPIWGNYGEDGGGECGVPTFHRYVCPDNGNAVFWYSFDYGLVHVIMYSSEHDFTYGSRQFLWIEQDLKSVDRRKTPWIIATSHRPMYTSQSVSSDHIVGRHMRLSLEELFYRYRVNLHLSGHYHSYESTCSVLGGDCVAPGRGTVYVVVGTAGKFLDPQDYWDYPWSKYQQADKYGYQRMVANHTHLHVQFVVVPEMMVTDDITIPLWEENNETEQFF